MSKTRDFDRLGQVAQVTLDHRLGLMRAATAALDRSKAQLATINAAGSPADLPLVASARAEWTYQRWADLRRGELNLVIARQTADRLTALDAAKTAFGRLEALRGLARSSKDRDRLS